MKKVLIISNYMYPHIGGIEQVSRDISNALRECDNIKQKIICFNEDAGDGEYVCKRSETVIDIVDGIDVIRCGCFTKVFSQSLSTSYRKQLKTVFNSFNPDIVLLQFPNPFVSAILLSIMPKETKFILYWHLDITKQKYLKKLFHIQTIKLLQRANAVVATSPNYIEGSSYLRKFKDKCNVIPNCIRTERLTTTPEIEMRVSEIKEKYKGKTIVFAVGRHVPYKGIGYLVKASKMLDDNFAVLIGGKGELTDSLKVEAADDNKVVFLGRVSDNDLIAYYIACDIFAFPSITKNEAFGIALAEGMYFGNPAVTFTIPGSGVNYVSLADKTGIECPNCDFKAYAEALIKLRNNPDLRAQFGKEAKSRIENEFMFDRFKENIKLLINRF